MKYKNDTQIQALKIYPTGYYVYYRINGKRRSMKLGSLDLPIKVARNLAQKNLGPSSYWNRSNGQEEQAHIR